MNGENWRTPSAILAAFLLASTATTGSDAGDGASVTAPVQGPDAGAQTQPTPAGAVGAAMIPPAGAPTAPARWDQTISPPPAPDQTMGPGYGQMMDPGYGQMMDPGYGQMMDPGYGQMMDPGYGQMMDPGYGQMMDPGYGQMMTPGYGQIMTPGYGQGMTPGYPTGAAIQGQRYVALAQMMQGQHQQRMIERLDAIVNRLERIEQVLREQGR